LNPKILSQLVQPIVLQVRHPGMDPQGTQDNALRNNPLLQRHIVENIVKLLVVSQIRHTDELLHYRHPIGHA
jgi:hypothetical protein